MINDNKCSNDDFKECTKCGELKPSNIQYFHKLYDGTRNICKVCVSKYKKDYDAKVDSTKQSKQYYQDNKEYYKQYSKNYRKTNRDKINKKRREYYEIYGR